MNEAETRAELIDRTSPHFRAFTNLACIEGQGEGEGKVPSEWAPKDMLGRDRLPKRKLKRADLHELAADPSASIDAVCWSILAWGGMYDSNRDHLGRVTDRIWLDLAEDIRAGGLDRRTAYRAFAGLRAGTGKKLSGMRPAYFTKLIFFLMPRDRESNPPGYIMDQWAGCSINVLANRDVVLMDCNGTWQATRNGPMLKWDHHVSDANDDARYEDYCQCIEALARQIGQAPEVAERLLLAGRRNREGTWRRYVIEHRKPPGTPGAAA